MHQALNPELSVSKPDEIPDEYDIMHYIIEQLPSSGALQLSLTALLPHCISLEDIYHEGVLHQESLDEITKLVQTPIRSLRLRVRPPKYHCRWFNAHPPYGLLRDGWSALHMRLDFEHYYLRWQNLSRLKRLRRLEVSRVWQKEGAGLAKAIEELNNLEILAVVAAVPSIVDLNELEEVSAMNDFLAHIFPIDDKETKNGCKLPRGLKSLTFSDPRQRYENLKSYLIFQRSN